MRSAIAFLVFAALMGPVGAQESGDSARGKLLAERICSECHAMVPRSPHPASGIASFEAIANTPGMTAMALFVWLTSPHRDMPHIILTSRDRTDIIAYITGLKR